MSGTTPADPLPPNTNKVEPKVWWATVGSYLAGLVALLVINLSDDQTKLLISALPDTIEPLVLPLVPAIVAFAGGYVARHQWRTAGVQGNRTTIG